MMTEVAEMSRRSIVEQPNPSTSVLRLLTNREWTIARALAEGLSYSEIAASLSISVHTVASHVKAILQKTSLPSSRRVGALVYAYDREQHRQ